MKSLKTLFEWVRFTSVPLFVLLSISVFFSGCQHPNAENITLPKVFGSNMVLQRNAAIAVWGTADPGGIIQVTLQDAEKTAESDKDGKWSLALPAMEAGGPYEMTVKGAKDTTFSNILIGDVWVASGQSNMEWSLKAQVDNFQQEIANANYPEIRLFTVTKDTSPMERPDIKEGSWAECTPQTVPDFSAVAYFFGRDLYQEEKIPIGLIHTSWGGTPSEAWTSKATIKTFEDFRPAVEKLDAMSASYEENQNKPKNNQTTREKITSDANAKINAPDFKPEFDESQWKTMAIPVLWESAQGAGMSDYDGFVWFSKEVRVPANYAGKPLALHLGKVDDKDITWFNGTKIGETNIYSELRNYTVPGKLVKAGTNKIIIRVEDTGGGGGVYGPGEEMKVASADQKFSKSLTGDWKYNETLEPKFPVVASQFPNQPSVLYNAMIAPLIPYTIKGAIWYQGESNADRAYQYRSIFPAMIEDWRKNWGIGNFPFLFVQLANFKEKKPEPADDDWAELREAQVMALSLPKTGMAVAIDIGEAEDIHPKNKQDVGKRLALAARKVAYDEDLVYAGPMYESMKKEGNQIIIKFNNVGSGLMKLPDEKLKGFAIAGEDQQFVWAEAEIISEDEIRVSSPKVKNPAAVRYGWASNPEVNLYNEEGLPASPFRTDDWKGITEPDDV